MDKLTHLASLRKQYLELTKLFFYEIQKGRSVTDVSDLKNRIDSLLVEINHLEKELNINHHNTDLATE
jgi:hypothetical protein